MSAALGNGGGHRHPAGVPPGRVMRPHVRRRPSPSPSPCMSGSRLRCRSDAPGGGSPRRQPGSPQNRPAGGCGTSDRIPSGARSRSPAPSADRSVSARGSAPKREIMQKIPFRTTRMRFLPHGVSRGAGSRESRVRPILTGGEHEPHATSVRKSHIPQRECADGSIFFATGRWTWRRSGGPKLGRLRGVEHERHGPDGRRLGALRAARCFVGRARLGRGREDQARLLTRRRRWGSAPAPVRRTRIGWGGPNDRPVGRGPFGRGRRPLEPQHAACGGAVGRLRRML